MKCFEYLAGCFLRAIMTCHLFYKPSALVFTGTSKKLCMLATPQNVDNGSHQL